MNVYSSCLFNALRNTLLHALFFIAVNLINCGWKRRHLSKFPHLCSCDSKADSTWWRRNKFWRQMSFCSRHLHGTNKTFNIDVTVSSCMFLPRVDSFTFSVSLSERDYHNCRQTAVLTLIWEEDRSENLFLSFCFIWKLYAHIFWILV